MKRKENIYIFYQLVQLGLICILTFLNFLFFCYLFPSCTVLLDNFFVFIENLLEYRLQYFTKYFLLLNRRNIILLVFNFAILL